MTDAIQSRIKHNDCFYMYGVKCYLTGSRFFDPENSANSDIDIFAEYTPLLVSKLSQAGFVNLTTTSYLDSDCVYVFRLPSENTKQVVDFQLVRNLDLRVQVRNYIKGKPELLKFLKRASKLGKSSLWNKVYILIRRLNGALETIEDCKKLEQTILSNLY